MLGCELVSWGLLRDALAKLVLLFRPRGSKERLGEERASTLKSIVEVCLVGSLALLSYFLHP
jgi:hypothetical protein